MTAARPRRSILVVVGALALGIAAPAGAEVPWAPARVRRDLARQHARDVERALSELPDVARAKAQVWLPDPLQTPLDQAPEAPRVDVRLRLRQGAPTAPGFRTRVREVAASQVPNASPESVQVALNGGAQAAVAGPPRDGALVRVGPFETSVASAPWLRVTLGALLGGLLTLASLLARYARRAMRDRPAP